MFPLNILYSLIFFLVPLSPHTIRALRAEYPIQDKWVKIELEKLSFYVMPELEFQNKGGIDSSVWRYSSKDLKLYVDLGQYSGKPKIYESEPDYREEQIIIDGKKAVMCFYRRSTVAKEDLPYSAAVYFPKINARGDKLSLYVAGASTKEQVIARKIFLSIEFK